MAAPTTKPSAQYAGVATGPRLSYVLDAQTGQPIDGTNERLRNLSPFTLRYVLPDALLGNSFEQKDLGDLNGQARSIDLIGGGARSANNTPFCQSIAKALGARSASGTVSDLNIANLSSFVAKGVGVVARQSSGSIPALADAYTAADIKLQVLRLVDTPPLTLLVNPTEMSVNYAKLQSFQDRSRSGYIFQSWGEERTTISFSGTTAGFVSGAGTTGQDSRGYHPAARRSSAAWQNFMALFEFYRSNGYVYDTANKSEAHLFIGSIALDYDQFTYVGNIDTLSYSHDAANPHRIQFDMEFVVTRMYDNAQNGGTVGPENSGGSGLAQSVSLSNPSGSSQVASGPEQSVSPLDLLV